MRSTAAEALASAVDALTRVDADELSVAEMQELIAVVGPQIDRLGGVLSTAVAALQVRTGGTVTASPAPDGRPAPVVAVRHWLRDTLSCGGPRCLRTGQSRRRPAVPAARRRSRP